MKLFENLYAYLWPGVNMSEMQKFGNNCNSYVITECLAGGKHLLIDPGNNMNEMRHRCLDRLLVEMNSDDIKVEDIGMMIYTHAHPDHYEAGAALKEMSNALVAVSKVEDDFMDTIGKQLGKQLQAMGFRMPPINADVFLQEGTLDLGDGKLSLEILLTPGHSAGHIGIYWPDMKVYFGGDLIFSGSTGRVDLPGGSSQQLKESINRVSRLDIECLCTGHQYGSPGVIQGQENINKNFDFIKRNIYPYL